MQRDRRVQSAALLVRSVAFGEADLIATFFTETSGTVSTLVRGARRSTKRFGGALEPIHGLVVAFDDGARDLATLREARIERPRLGIVRSLDAMEVAGLALRWVRHVCSARTPEPMVWSALAWLLDALDAECSEHDGALPTLMGNTCLARFGFALLANGGYAIDFNQCVRCAKVCPPGRAAFVDAARGGLICAACGGGRRTVDAELRRVASRLAATPVQEDLALTAVQATVLLSIVEDAMSAHADFDPHASLGR
jgi:DNA repair protein RecO (recombination protein O)